MPRRSSARTSRASMSRRLRIVQMIVAEQVQRSVDEQVRRMVLDADAFVRRLGVADAAGKHDIAKQEFRPGNNCLLEFLGFASGNDRTLVGLSLSRHSALSARTSFVAGQPDRELDGTIGFGEVRVGAFGDRCLGRAAHERVPGLATVPFLVGLDVDLRASRVSSPGLHRPRRCGRRAGGGRRRRRRSGPW